MSRRDPEVKSDHAANAPTPKEGCITKIGIKMPHCLPFKIFLKRWGQNAGYAKISGEEKLFPYRTAQAFTEATITAFRLIPAGKRKNFTCEHGKEFSMHEELKDWGTGSIC